MAALGIEGLGDSPVGWWPVNAGDLSSLVVAVDGTSGSGKSSTCRAVADRLGLRYLDTGAMYRAMAWWMLQHDVNIYDVARGGGARARPELESGTDPLRPTITLDGVDVSVEIRSDAVNAAVSPVSTVPAVRARLVELAAGRSSAPAASWSRAATSAPSSGRRPG